MRYVVAMMGDARSSVTTAGGRRDWQGRCVEENENLRGSWRRMASMLLWEMGKTQVSAQNFWQLGINGRKLYSNSVLFSI